MFLCLKEKKTFVKTVESVPSNGMFQHLRRKIWAARFPLYKIPIRIPSQSSRLGKRSPTLINN